jgi:hypothetical protein
VSALDTWRKLCLGLERNRRAPIKSESTVNLRVGSSQKPLLSCLPTAMSSLPRLEYYLINAFTTDSPHSGNQAAVVLFPSATDPRASDDVFLLTTAKDFGYSETAYLVPTDEEAGEWSLRWFTIYNVRRFSLANE